MNAFEFWFDMHRSKCHMKALQFLRSDSGATAIEYGLVASLIFLTIVGAVGTLGTSIFNNLYNQIAVAL